MDIQEELSLVMASLAIDGWGYAGLSGLPGGTPVGFPVAISMLKALEWQGGIPLGEEREEEEFNRAHLEAEDRLDLAAAAVIGFLDERGVRNVLVKGQDDETLTCFFQHKTAARLAGLGVIGRNSLLVTERFGPRVELATVLADVDVETGTPQAVASPCRDCSACIEACPFGSVTGGLWEPGVSRDELIDARSCDSARLSYIPKIGRKLACGRCELYCPVGRVGSGLES